MFSKFKFRFTYTQIIASGFICVILIGGLLLTLPISSKANQATGIVDSLFTATSATCVTGLVAFDTYTHWSTFGQIVILSMIQIGGLGLMTVISMLLIFSKKKINLYERKLFMQSTGALKISGIVSQIRRIIIGTFIVEGVGAAFLATQFIPEMGVGKGLYYSVFHSVSAFCNAGFDLMGYKDQFTSFTSYFDNPVVNLTLIVLIIVGGIGFIVWDDIRFHGFKLKEYQLHSKIVLTATAILVLSGWGLFYLFESQGQLADMSFGDRLMTSLFQSVTTRTAGFNTIDMAGLTNSSVILTVVLMVIGGSPGSTAGGIKTTTLMVLILSAYSLIRKKNGIHIYRRHLDDNAVKQAGAIATVYFSLVIIFTCFICYLEPYSLSQILFEVASAIGTVGLSTGITPSLCNISKILLLILMYAGRIGGFTLVLLIAEKREYVPLDRPTEKIIIG